MQSLWRDARVEPLDERTGTGENYPVDDFRLIMSVRRLWCAEVGQTFAGVPRGEATGKFSGSGKAHRLFRCSGALWLATMLNLPNHPPTIWKLRRSAAGDLWFCDLPGSKMPDAGVESMNIGSDWK